MLLHLNVRRLSLRLAMICVVLILSFRVQAAHPNVVLIMTDDQGWGDIGAHGNDEIHTPTLDTLHDSSVRFDRFYVSPVCAPTRAALLTGRYPVRTGVTGVTQRYEVMRADEVTLAEVFQANNYVTGCFGKWHNGEQYPNHPLGQGFDEFFGFCGGHWNDYFDTTLEHNRQQVETHGYITDVLTDQAIDFIGEHRGEPFFCYIPYNAPHTPWQVPDRYFDKYADRGLPVETACAYAMLENIDDNVGRVLKQLDQHGLRAQTIVIFLTDNGPNSDRYNGGMRGRKGSVHEGGVRVPCFVSWPGRLEPKVVRQIAAHIDLLPTLVELCGLALPETRPLDGISLVPLLTTAAESAPAAWSDRRLITHRSTRDGQGRLILRGAVRSQRYRYVRERGRAELFDMQEDPGQTTDISKQQPEVFGQLQRDYDEWLETTMAADPLRTPIPVGFTASPVVQLPAVESLSVGNPQFHNRNGFAHDWITNWSSPADRIWWDLNVATAGTYEVTLQYACSKSDVGSSVICAISTGDDQPSVQSVTANLSRSFDPGKVPRPERDRSETPRWMREFATLRLGQLRFPAGSVRLELRADTIPGSSVCELGGLELQLSDSSNDSTNPKETP